MQLNRDELIRAPAGTDPPARRQPTANGFETTIEKEVGAERDGRKGGETTGRELGLTARVANGHQREQSDAERDRRSPRQADSFARCSLRQWTRKYFQRRWAAMVAPRPLQRATR